jgi:dephospho-CoA kinase
LIIGLTGTFAAGKDTVAEYFEKEKSFEHFSTGAIVTDIARERGIEPTRDNLRELGNTLRDKYGPDYLSRQAIEKKAKTDKVVITGLRQPGEIKYLQSLGNFYLIAVDAPIELRFERMQERHRPGDPATIDEMREKEKKEMEASGANAQKIKECMTMADYFIVNDTTIKELNKHAEEIYRQIIASSTHTS